MSDVSEKLAAAGFAPVENLTHFHVAESDWMIGEIDGCAVLWEPDGVCSSGNCHDLVPLPNPAPQAAEIERLTTENNELRDTAQRIESEWDRLKAKAGSDIEYRDKLYYEARDKVASLTEQVATLTAECERRKEAEENACSYAHDSEHAGRVLEAELTAERDRWKELATRFRECLRIATDEPAVWIVSSDSLHRACRDFDAMTAPPADSDEWTLERLAREKMPATAALAGTLQEIADRADCDGARIEKIEVRYGVPASGPLVPWTAETRPRGVVMLRDKNGVAEFSPMWSPIGILLYGPFAMPWDQMSQLLEWSRDGITWNPCGTRQGVST